MTRRPVRPRHFLLGMLAISAALCGRSEAQYLCPNGAYAARVLTAPTSAAEEVVS